MDYQKGINSMGLGGMLGGLFGRSDPVPQQAYNWVEDEQMAKFDPARDWEKKQALRDAAHKAKRETGKLPGADALLQREMDRWAERVRAEEEEARRRFEERRMGYYDPGYEKAAKTGFIPQPQRDRYDGQPDVQFIRNGAGGMDIYVIERGTAYKLVREDEIKKSLPPPIRPGELRTEWLKEAHDRCMASEKVIRLQMEGDGLVLIGTQGDDYETRSIKWDVLEAADKNIIIPQIELLEHQLDIIGKLKDAEKNRGDKPKAA